MTARSRNPRPSGRGGSQCGKPLHPILVAAAERFHELCRPEPVKHWRLR